MQRHSDRQTDGQTAVCGCTVSVVEVETYNLESYYVIDLLAVFFLEFLSIEQ